MRCFSLITDCNNELLFAIGTAGVVVVTAVIGGIISVDNALSDLERDRFGVLSISISFNDRLSLLDLRSSDSILL